MVRSRTFRSGLAAVVTGITLTALPAQSSVLEVFEVNADDAAGIQYTVDSFRNALGALNANAPVNGDPYGRREINWDAAPDRVSDPNLFPGDFFNANVAPRARGIEFKGANGTTGFELSATEASGEPIEFGFENGFTFFSAERLFTPVGGGEFDVLFFDPADQTSRALTRGLGVVFTDVESETFDQKSTMSFYDINDELLFSRDVLSGNNAGLSFLGVLFDAAEVARVRIFAGLENRDSVVMDDFIFGEPIAADAVAVPSPTPALLLLGGLLSFGWFRKRPR